MAATVEKEKRKALEAGVEEIDTLQDGSHKANLKVMERETWGGKMEFLLSCIGYAVGLGTIWRFPYLCYRNGGGAFLVPYIIFLILFGMPLVVLEMGYGQFSSKSPISIWDISPLFKGVGYGMVIISGVVCVYYNVIIAWTLYYFGMSFQSPLPWSHCKNSWNTPLCSDLWKTRANATFGNATANDTGVMATVSSAAYTLAGVVDNITALTNTSVAPPDVKSPSEEFWENNVLEMSGGIENMGGVRWQLLVCLFVSWVFVFLCLIKGVKSSGKVVYVTATFPYVVLIVFLVRGVTLPGAMEGIKFYLIPRFEKLLEFQVWQDAAMQLFYSMGAAWGALITMSSYNKFKNNFYRDAIIVSIADTCTAILAGFVIFTVIGFMAHETGKDIGEVITKGPGLVFVVYPAAITRMPIAPLWAVLFFLFLFTVGVDSQFGMFETMTSAFLDEYPKYLRPKKMLFHGILCFIAFLLGIPCVTRGGVYFLQIMDWYASTFSLMVLSLTEVLAIAWIYGVNRFYDDISMMIGYKPFIWWKVCWMVITPLMILFILLTSLAKHTSVTYGDYVYPGWAIGIGWIIASCSVVPLPTIAIYKFFKAKGTIMQRWRKVTQPTKQWGPADPILKKEYDSQHERNMSNGHFAYMPTAVNIESGTPMVDMTKC